MVDHYVLDGHTPVPTDLLTWARWFDDVRNRRVAEDRVGAVRVSTLFLGLNHQFGDGPPLLFETMIFGGKYDEYQTRASTWDEAVAQHATAVALAKEK